MATFYIQEQRKKCLTFLRNGEAKLSTEQNHCGKKSHRHHLDVHGGCTNMCPYNGPHNKAAPLTTGFPDYFDKKLSTSYTRTRKSVTKRLKASFTASGGTTSAFGRDTLGGGHQQAALPQRAAKGYTFHSALPRTFHSALPRIYFPRKSAKEGISLAARCGRSAEERYGRYIPWQRAVEGLWKRCVEVSLWAFVARARRYRTVSTTTATSRTAAIPATTPREIGMARAVLSVGRR
ncbi:hypothetical protein Bbelb_268530 [Branchiostoma belcheri]|nr:hypothetical protein Bbelb_268530 [Branchiostoma belcheri]